MGGIANYITYEDFYKDNNNNLVVELSRISHDTIKKFALLDGVWIATNASKPVNREKIIYDSTNHTVSVKDSNNKTIFTDTNLPTIKEIELATDKNLTNRKIYYSPYYDPYQDGKNFIWDKKTHLISACKDKYYCLNLQFFAIKQNDIYNIGFLKLDTTMDSRLDQHSTCLTDFTLLSIAPQYRDIKTIIDKFICLVKENNKIVVKKMFGEIYPLNYLKSMVNITDATISSGFIPINFFFDEKDNLHIFYYTSEDNADKYISYAMFTPDEPTIPKYKQKIYWK